MQNILNIAKKLGLKKNEVILYGNDMAKIDKKEGKRKGKLILVTALNPTTAGEGKTTVSIGLADALNLCKKKVCLALREPSLGPVFGMKGGATGGGKSSIVPADEINLHFTGDFHAITSANNLLCAMIDNHIFQGNVLGIKKVIFNRCLDVNDRALRNIIIKGDGKKYQDREEVFNITAASEIMAIMCVAKDIDDLIERIGNIVVGYNNEEKPVYARDLKAEKAMAILLKDAIKPNLVQTLIGTPAIVHCGPFANIAHGCNSVIATNLALCLSDYVVTEAGFGADLGAQKFLDFKCRVDNLNPNAVVIVATIKALKLHGEDENNLEAIRKGLPNLYKHISNIKEVYNLPYVVAINKFTDDTNEEIEFLENELKQNNIKYELVDVWTESGKNAINLAKTIIEICDRPLQKMSFSYDFNDKIEKKCTDIATKIYGAKKVVFEEKAKENIKEIKKLGYDKLPIIIAKTQYSLTDNPKVFGAPKDFEITIKEIQLRAGVGFLVAIAGNMLLMPGLPKKPKAVSMEIKEENGKIEYKL